MRPPSPGTSSSTPPSTSGTSPPRSATRVGHPAPFPVELPRRLIELYTYRGDLILDPFIGSGSTAVAAVRTERHYAGFDTDEAYVALAERRIAEERAAIAQPAATGEVVRRVTVPRGRSLDRDGDGDGDLSEEERAVRAGHKAQQVAHLALVSSGFVDIECDVALGDLGLTVDFRARDATGGRWLFDLAGAFSATRPGLRRPDVLWRALGMASVLHEIRRRDPSRDDLGPLVLLSTDTPAPRSAGGKALRAVQGDDRSGPVYDVLELFDRESMERLRVYGQGAGRHG